MVSIRSADVTVAGVRSLVRVGGPEDASEAVVFVHGNPGSSEDYADLLAHVSDFARVLAPDMPGYGKADRPRGFPYTVRGYATHLGGLLEKQGVRRAHLVLHDFGGPWGLAWAAAHPERVASITLLNVGVLRGYRWHKFARIWRTPILGELFQLTTSRLALKLALNADNPRPLPDAFIERMHRDADWPMKRAVLALYRATGDLGGMGERLAEALEPHHFPALVLWGEGDKYIPVRYAEEQTEFFDAQVHVLEGCGHWPMIDDPERVRELVVPFLRAQLGVA
jgi:pimeloyl-ACP methyl ester carboxylesterase